MLALVGAATAAVPLLGNLEVYTSFPTDVGLRGTLEGPGRVRITGSAGLLPRPYLGLINDTATSAGWYTEEDATLIDAALREAVVLRAHLGWRPFRDLGFQFELGYGRIGLGGGLTGAEVIEAYTGYDLEDVMGKGYELTAAADMHRLDLSVGWEHVIARHFLIRWDVGGSWTFDAKAKVERDFDAFWPLDDLIDDATDDVEDDLEATLERSVHTPIVALGVGWRFQ
jgi:hypothetical protein